MKIQNSFYKYIAILIALLPLTVVGAIIDLDSQPYIVMGTPALSSSNVRTSPAALYEVRFNNVNFTGDLIARAVASTGNVTEDTFDTNGLITADNSHWRASRNLRFRLTAYRDIFTSQANGVAKAFVWSSLADESKLLIDPEANVSDSSNNILDWVRGSSANEGSGVTNYRDRTVNWINGETYHNRLGSIVGSSPAYVGAPSNFYNENDYAAFRLANRARTPMVYVGVNDGMLHGFNATTTSKGKEIFAYVPHSILGVLKDHVAMDNANQVYSVDGSPIVADVYGSFPLCSSSPCWRTVLVSGLNGGGRGVFALDVTDPAATVFTDNDAKKLFLWELEAGDTGVGQDLGFTFSRPIIAQLSDGTWVAIFGNGYNNTGDGKAALIVVQLDDGSVIKKLTITPASANTDEAPNGLSSVTGWDNNNNGKIDYVYAGDLFGNLWKFDLTQAKKDGTGIKVAYGSTSTHKPLIRVVDGGTSDGIPITAAPAVTLREDGSLIVYFANGIALDESHEIVAGDRSVFGIFDNKVAGDTYNPPYATHPNSSYSLTTHTIGISAAKTDTDSTAGLLRGIKTTSASTNNVGWELKLDGTEQALSDLIISNKRVNFSSVESILSVNNFNWLNSVDFLTGGAPAAPVFDSDQDDDIDANDTINIVDGPSTVVPIGGALGKGVASAPRLVSVETDRDVMLITLAVELTTVFNSPFTDPGLVGGHFDEDESFLPLAEIDWKSSLPYNKELFDSHTHVHEYDDKYDTNGVNLLTVSSAVPTDPPNVETAPGMPDKYDSLQGAMTEGKLKNSIGDVLVSTDTVEISIINPYSVDNSVWATERGVAGVSDGTVAEAGVFYFGCSDPAWGGTQYLSSSTPDADGNYTGGISAPLFAALDAADRTCTIGGITELRIRYNDINAMRATTPGCVKDKNIEGPVLPVQVTGETPAAQNTQYRDGAFVVRATLYYGANHGGQQGDKEPIWENYNYEHLKDLTSDADRGIKCGVINEDLRKYRPIESDITADICKGLKKKEKEACEAAAAAAGSGGNSNNYDYDNIEYAGQGGFVGFIGNEINVAIDPDTGVTEDTTKFSTSVPDTRRINWREILAE